MTRQNTLDGSNQPESSAHVTMGQVRPTNASHPKMWSLTLCLTAHIKVAGRSSVTSRKSGIMPPRNALDSRVQNSRLGDPPRRNMTLRSSRGTPFSPRLTNLFCRMAFEVGWWPGINGLTVHVLEAGFETPHRPLVLLIHGFPELAFSWRKLLLPLAEAGFPVVAPDQRGYGRTTGWIADFDDDVAPFRLLNLARDAGRVWRGRTTGAATSVAASLDRVRRQSARASAKGNAVSRNPTIATRTEFNIRRASGSDQTLRPTDYESLRDASVTRRNG